MKYILNIILISILINLSCVSFKSKLYQMGNKENVMHNAILDYSNSRHFKKDSVFFVSFIDTFYTEKIVKQEYGISSIFPDIKYDNIVAVRIGGNGDFRTNIPKYTADSALYFLSYKTLVVNGKLFFWHDKKSKMTKDNVNILYKYGVFRTDSLNITQIYPSQSIDDSKKGIHYYFCRNQINKYKRVFTNYAMGTYTPPKIKCN